MTTAKADESFWKLDQTFTQDDVAVEVSVSRGYQPMYNYRISWRTAEKGSGWFQVKDGGKSRADAISGLVKNAESYIDLKRSEWRAVEEKKQAERAAKDAESADRAKAKKKHYEDNKEKRREENRARANRK